MGQGVFDRARLVFLVKPLAVQCVLQVGPVRADPRTGDVDLLLVYAKMCCAA
jgi:hypothetical protein